MRAAYSTFYANGTAVRIEADGEPSRCEPSRCILADEKNAEFLAVEGGGEVS